MFTTAEIQIVEQSWEYIVENTENAGKDFYDYLFKISPQLRQVFPADMTRQEHKLISLITFVVKRLSNMPQLEQEVKELGKRHSQYGAQPEHYLLVKNALLILLQNGLKNKWTVAHGMAWEKVYNTLSATMQKGANEN